MLVVCILVGDKMADSTQGDENLAGGNPVKDTVVEGILPEDHRGSRAFRSPQEDTSPKDSFAAGEKHHRSQEVERRIAGLQEGKQ